MSLLEDTIAAIATPIGEGGLAVIRVSGPGAVQVADKCFVGPKQSSITPSAAPTHTVHYGHVIKDGTVVDEVLLTVMRAPRTFTREDVVEFACHGGVLSAKLVLDATLTSGARLAEPGEFTRRAFLNGRIDLTQAEAVVDLIHSRTELALRAANEQLAGKLARRVDELREQMMKILAHVEAHIDFPEEDIAPETRAGLIAKLEQGVAFMERLLLTAEEGQVLRRGLRAAIIGRPNAGKSSLLNQLLGRDRAIVSPMPGTTRDTIEETANIRGLPIVFVDTAGLRDTRDEIESEGVRRTRQSLERAELILHVLDASESLTVADQALLEEFASRKRILVRNKMDLPIRLEMPYPLDAGNPTAARPIPAMVDVSCVNGTGIESLKDTIKDLTWSGALNAEHLEVMINSRHQDALSRARDAALTTLEALRGEQGLELVALDLRIAVNAIGEIVGKTATDDLLDLIFSQFCIGK